MRSGTWMAAAVLVGLVGACGTDTTSATDTTSETASSVTDGTTTAPNRPPRGPAADLLVRDCAQDPLRKQVQDFLDGKRPERGEEGERPPPPDGDRADADRPPPPDGAGQDGERPPPPDGEDRAPDGNGKGRPPPGLPMHALAHAYDADASKSLEDTEKASVLADLDTRCENRLALLLARYDANGDTTLDDTEWQAAENDVKARLDARKAAMDAAADTNGDGTVSDDERKASMDAHRPPGGPAQFDLDHDGQLSDTDRSAADEWIRADVRGEHFAKFFEE